MSKSGDEYRSSRGLDLEGSEISDLEPIKGLSSLQWLDLSGTQVSDDEVAKLEKALPELKIVR